MYMGYKFVLILVKGGSQWKNGEIFQGGGGGQPIPPFFLGPEKDSFKQFNMVWNMKKIIIKIPIVTPPPIMKLKLSKQRLI